MTESLTPTMDGPATTSEPTNVARRRRPLLLVGVLALVAAIVASGLWLAYRGAADMVQGMADADTVNVSAKITARVAACSSVKATGLPWGKSCSSSTAPRYSRSNVRSPPCWRRREHRNRRLRKGRARKEIRAAHANLRRAEAAGELAQSTYARIRILFTQGVVTRQRHEEAQAQARSAAEAIAAARAQHDQAVAGTRRQDRQAARAQVSRPRALSLRCRLPATRPMVARRHPGKSASVSQTWVSLSPQGTRYSRSWTSTNCGSRCICAKTSSRPCVSGGRLYGDIPALGLQRVAFEVYFIAPAGDFATWRATGSRPGVRCQAALKRRRLCL